MKFAQRLAVLLLSLVPLACAAVQPVSFYAQAGFGLVASRGDLNNHVYKVKDDDNIKGNLHPPTIKISGTPDLAVGVNLKNLSLALDFQYWSSSQSLTGYPDASMEQPTSIMRLGAEFTYNVFWPEFFQAGLGGGLSYSNISVEKNLFFGSDRYDTDFSGLGFGLIANLHYSVTPNISMVPALKIYKNYFFGAEASKAELDETLRQTFVLATLSLQYQF